MEFEFKVTVIIPVYNVGRYLEECLNSLLAQTIPQQEMEVLMINDGSYDESLKICECYAAAHDNFKVISQENRGVSAARNNGILNARGKYLLYLDGDDTLSSETVKNVTDFFDDHYDEIDMVTYPIVNIRNGQPVPLHFRYTKYLTRTGVYPLDKYPYIALTTINVCEKNISGNPMFDETVKLAEDQIHDTFFLGRKGKIGYVKEAQYIYFHGSENTTKKMSQSKYSFEPYMNLFHCLMKIKAPNMVDYCVGIILYNISWRIPDNVFLPSHLCGTAYDEAMTALRAIIEQIPNQIILSYPHMDLAYRWYLLSLKTENRPFVCADKNGLKILDNTGQIAIQTQIPVVVEQIETVPGGFYMIAYVKCFAFAFTQEFPRLFVQLPGKPQQELSLFFSQNSCYWTKFETNRFFAFHLFIPNEHLGKVRLKMSLHGVTYPVRFFYVAKQRVHPDIGCRYLDGKSHGLLCLTDSLEIKKAADPNFITEKRTFEKRLWKERKKQWLARQVMKLSSHKRVWLYYDSHDSLDNGYYQFLHDIEKNDGVKRYYIYHANNSELIQGKFSGKAKRALIKFGSIQHKQLMAAAEKLLVAFIGRSCYLPFDPDTYQYYADLFHYQVVYLQHGVMHAKLPNMYSKEKVWQVDQIVVSTRFERENLLKLGYRKEDILTSGMPRLDRLSTTLSVGQERKLLFAPSWRYSLVKIENGVQTPVEKFYASTYYQEFSSLLKSKQLHKFLDENDLYLDVQTHPMFSCYKECFLPAGSERIRETQFANVADYLACITDFSSLMFDFTYLDKPVISYFPDQEEFRNGSHSYNDFYYPLEDGFALYCKDRMTVLETLQQLSAKGFALPPRLAERVQDFYFSRKADHMESLYRALIGGK